MPKKPAYDPTSRVPFLQQHYALHNGPCRTAAAHHLLTQHLFEKHSARTSPTIHHIYNSDSKRETVETLMNGPDSDIWNKSMSMEIGQLAQGNKYGVKSIDTIDFIFKSEVPTGKSITYANFVCEIFTLSSPNPTESDL